MAYTTQTKIEQFHGITLTAAQAAFLPTIISAVKLWIDRYCGKTFEGTSETRYYDGNGLNRIVIDSFYGTPTVTLINWDGSEEKILTEGQDDDYVVYPYNGTEKYEILLTANGYSRRFSKGNYRVKVTATFGFAASVPADIELAATRIAGQMIQNNTPDGMVQTSVTLGDYSATFEAAEDTARALGIYSTLDQYRDIDI